MGPGLSENSPATLLSNSPVSQQHQGVSFAQQHSQVQSAGPGSSRFPFNRRLSSTLPRDAAHGTTAEMERVRIENHKHVAIFVNNESVPLVNGRMELGRSFKLGAHGEFLSDLRVSRNHGTLRWDAESQCFMYRDNNSTSGTYIKDLETGNFIHIRGTEIPVGPHHEIRLGSLDGPALDFAMLTGSSNRSTVFEHEVYLDGKSLGTEGGIVNIGINHQVFGTGQLDALNRQVSREHGFLSWQPAEGRYYYEDTSLNGTFIRRAGETEFQQVHQSGTYLDPHDEIRLGSQYGPMLKINAVRGHVSAEGETVFSRADGTFVRRPDGRSDFYDNAGLSRTADARGRVIQATDSLGIVRTYEYSGEQTTPSRITLRDSAGNIQTFESNSADNRHWRISNSNGTYSEWRGEIGIEPDGSFRYNDGVNPPVIERLDGTREFHYPSGHIDYVGSKLAIERARLVRFAECHIDNQERRTRFNTLVADLERSIHANRQNEEARLAQQLRRPLNAEERSRLDEQYMHETALAYHQLNRLMSAGDNAILPKSQRVKMAEILLYETARPHEIDQGQNNTCPAASLRSRMSARRPSEAIRLVTDLSIEGKYCTIDGTKIDLSRVPGGLEFDAEARRCLDAPYNRASNSDLKLNGIRSAAGQLFEVAAFNIKFAQMSSATPGEVFLYEKRLAGDTAGERFVRYYAGTDGALAADPNCLVPSEKCIWDFEQASIYNQIVPSYESGFSRGNERNFVVRGPGQPFESSIRPGDAVVAQTEQELADVLFNMKARGSFPAIIMVDCHALGYDIPPQESGLHVMTVQDIREEYNPATGRTEVKVEYCTQHGQSRNRLGNNAATIDYLFQATVGQMHMLATPPPVPHPPAITPGSHGSEGGSEYLNRLSPAQRRVLEMQQRSQAETGDHIAPVPELEEERVHSEKLRSLLSEKTRTPYNENVVSPENPQNLLGKMGSLDDLKAAWSKPKQAATDLQKSIHDDFTRWWLARQGAVKGETKLFLPPDRIETLSSSERDPFDKLRAKVSGNDQYLVVWPDGKVSARFPDGSGYETDGNKCILKFSDGSEHLWTGGFEFKPMNGSIKLLDERSGQAVVKFLDGSLLTTEHSGLQYKQGTDGQINWIYSPELQGTLDLNPEGINTITTGYGEAFEIRGLRTKRDDAGNLLIASGTIHTHRGDFPFSIGKQAESSRQGPGSSAHFPGSADRTPGSLESRTKPQALERGQEQARARDVQSHPGAIDVDGRSISENTESRKWITNGFRELTPAEQKLAHEAVVKELKEVQLSPKSQASTGRSVYDFLMAESKLSEEQKLRILDAMAQVREHYTSLKGPDGKMLPDQEVNWIHTQGEFARVLEAANARDNAGKLTEHALTASETEEALLASMFSDSAKNVDSTVTKGNFTTHHLDGALAAREVLSRMGYPSDRLERVVQAIREHQIAPPEFMALIYRSTMGGALEAQHKQGRISTERYNELKAVLDSMTEKGADGALRIRKIAHINETPIVRNEKWQFELEFTPEERELLKLAGVEHWYVPTDPRRQEGFAELPQPKQEQLISSYKVSHALIDGDCTDNYATLTGASKIVKIRGPETGPFFKDATVWDSISSVDRSFRDSSAVFTEWGKKLATATISERDKFLHDAQNGIRAQMDEWLVNHPERPPLGKVPFYDVPLAYPETLTAEESTRLKELQDQLKSGGQSETQTNAIQREINSLKYKGLSERQVRDFEFAKQLRDHMVDLLRQAQRTDGQPPAGFEPVRGTAGTKEGQDTAPGKGGFTRSQEGLPIGTAVAPGSLASLKPEIRRSLNRTIHLYGLADLPPDPLESISRLSQSQFEKVIALAETKLDKKQYNNSVQSALFKDLLVETERRLATGELVLGNQRSAKADFDKLMSLAERASKSWQAKIPGLLLKHLDSSKFSELSLSQVEQLVNEVVLAKSLAANESDSHAREALVQKVALLAKHLQSPETLPSHERSSLDRIHESLKSFEELLRTKKLDVPQALSDALSTKSKSQSELISRAAQQEVEKLLSEGHLPRQLKQLAEELDKLLKEPAQETHDIQMDMNLEAARQILHGLNQPDPWTDYKERQAEIKLLLTLANKAARGEISFLPEGAYRTRNGYTLFPLGTRPDPSQTHLTPVNGFNPHGHPDSCNAATPAMYLSMILSKSALANFLLKTGSTAPIPIRNGRPVITDNHIMSECGDCRKGGVTMANVKFVESEPTEEERQRSRQTVFIIGDRPDSSTINQARALKQQELAVDYMEKAIEKVIGIASDGVPEAFTHSLPKDWQFEFFFCGEHLSAVVNNSARDPLNKEGTLTTEEYNYRTKQHTQSADHPTKRSVTYSSSGALLDSEEGKTVAAAPRYAGTAHEMETGEGSSIPAPAEAPDYAISLDALQAQKQFANEKQIWDKLPDGFRVAGRMEGLNIKGTPYYRGGLEDHMVVLDPEHDHYYREFVARMEHETDGLQSQPLVLAVEVASKIREVMEPLGKSPEEQAQWIKDRLSNWRGKHVLLGQYLEQQLGVCREQALLLKAVLDHLIGDQPGVEIGLVKGSLKHGDEVEGHSWVQLRVGGQEFIIDPRSENPLIEVPDTRYKVGEPSVLAGVQSSIDYSSVPPTQSEHFNNSASDAGTRESSKGESSSSRGITPEDLMKGNAAFTRIGPETRQYFTPESSQELSLNSQEMQISGNLDLLRLAKMQQQQEYADNFSREGIAYSPSPHEIEQANDATTGEAVQQQGNLTNWHNFIEQQAAQRRARYGEHEGTVIGAGEKPDPEMAKRKKNLAKELFKALDQSDKYLKNFEDIYDESTENLMIETAMLIKKAKSAGELTYSQIEDIFQNLKELRNKLKKDDQSLNQELNSIRDDIRQAQKQVDPEFGKRAFLDQLVRDMAQIQTPLETWKRNLSQADWSSFEAMKRTFGGGLDKIKESDWYCFDLGGNNYRLITTVDHKKRTVTVYAAWRHEVYDRWWTDKDKVKSPMSPQQTLQF
jgi:mRNA interferase HigB